MSSASPTPAPLPPLPSSITLTSSIIHATSNPKAPLYFLPTTPTTHTLNLTVQPYNPTLHTIRTRALLKDPSCALYSLQRTPCTDHYTINNANESHGSSIFTPGWLYGGTWVVSYSFFSSSFDRQIDLQLTCSDGKTWVVANPSLEILGLKEGTVVAEETIPVQDIMSEGGETIEFKKKVEEKLSREVKEVVIVAWLIKIWREKTKTELFSRGVRDKGEEGKNLRTW